MVTEESFAQAEKQFGKQIHFHDGLWWVRTAPFYYKPVHEFRPFPPGSAKPHPLKALLGYSHQVTDPAQATRCIRMNVLQGDDLRGFSLERLRGKKRNNVRQGVRNCRVEALTQCDVILDQMRMINISQARRFKEAGEGEKCLPPEYYEQHAAQWREETLKFFRHQGHQFVGAFVGDALAAYIDLIQIEDTWMFGAVKSSNEYLQYRPVDALYFSTLSMASQSGECNRVVNGGGDDERTSLTYFKGQFFLYPVTLPYYSRTILPIERLRSLQSRISFRRAGPIAFEKEAETKSCAESQE